MMIFSFVTAVMLVVWGILVGVIGGTDTAKGYGGLLILLGIVVASVTLLYVAYQLSFAA
jgi:hypothetical protein